MRAGQGIQYHLCNTYEGLWWLPGGCGRNLCQWRSVSTACFSCQWKCLFYFHHDGSWSLLSKHLLISSWQYLTSLPGLSRFYHLFVFAVLNVCDQRKIGQTWEHSSWSGHEVGKGTMFKYASPKLGECLNATNACLVPYLWLHFCVTPDERSETKKQVQRIFNFKLATASFLIIRIMTFTNYLHGLVCVHIKWYGPLFLAMEQWAY